MTLDIFSPQMHVIIKCTRQKQHILPTNVKYCVYTCTCKDVKMFRCLDVKMSVEELGTCKGQKMANNLAETAQDGNNGTMNSKVSNPC